MAAVNAGLQGNIVYHKGTHAISLLLLPSRFFCIRRV